MLHSQESKKLPPIKVPAESRDPQNMLAPSGPTFLSLTSSSPYGLEPWPSTIFKGSELNADDLSSYRLPT